MSLVKNRTEGIMFQVTNGVAHRAAFGITMICLLLLGAFTLLARAGSDTVTTSPAMPSNIPVTLQQRDTRYALHSGDTFDIAFPFTPEFNQVVTIQPDGHVTFLSIGDLYVAGKNIPELTAALKEAYGKELHNPVINITIKDFQKPYFIASGEIGKPGKYDLRDNTTLTEAIAIAGGFTEASKHSRVFLYRRVANTWTEVKEVDVKKMFASANLTEDLYLHAGDMVFVPQNKYSKFKRFIPSPGVGVSVNPY